MRTNLLLAAGWAALALSVSAVAAAQDAPRTKLDRSAPVSRADTLSMIDQRFDRIDTNKDGVLDAAEVAAMREQRRAKAEEWRAEREAKLAAAEANMTEEQKAARAQRRAKLQERWAERRQAMTAGADNQGGWFARLDADSDGRITREEFAVPVLRRFDRADADGDGMLTPEERAAARAARRAMRS